MESKKIFLDVCSVSENHEYVHSYVIHNLLPQSTYQLEVRARNMYGWSPVSKLHTFFTLSGTQAGSMPSKVVIFVLSESNVPSSEANQSHCLLSVHFIALLFSFH